MDVTIYTCIIFVLLFSCAHSKDCTTRDLCSCQFDDGTVIDITSLGNQDNTPRFKDVVATSEQNHYSYNPCFPFDEKDCSAAATCILNPDLSQAVQIGDASKASFKYDPDSKNVIAAYTSGTLTDLKLSEVILVCDKSACDPEFTADGQQEGGQFQMTLKHVCACPDECDSSGPKNCGGHHGHDHGGSSGVSTGGIICIVFFSVLIVYLITGAVFMKFVKKAEGKEVIPNVTFWRAVPVLIKDGVMFTLGRCFPRFRKTTYDEI